jgi:hypothetical protein
MEHAFGLMYQWHAARRNDRIVFGPRFATYPAVVQLPDGRPGLDVDLAVRTDANVVDRLCRLALAQYDEWSRTSEAAVGVVVDGAPRSCDADGWFDARGKTMTLRAGPYATQVDGPPPFRDRRLS